MMRRCAPGDTGEGPPPGTATTTNRKREIKASPRIKAAWVQCACHRCAETVANKPKGAERGQAVVAVHLWGPQTTGQKHTFSPGSALGPGLATLQLNASDGPERAPTTGTSQSGALLPGDGAIRMRQRYHCPCHAPQLKPRLGQAASVPAGALFGPLSACVCVTPNSFKSCSNCDVQHLRPTAHDSVA